MRSPKAAPLRLLAAATLLVAAAPSAGAAGARPGPPLTIHRAPAAITADGDLSDAGWQGADRITVWFETRIGDNVEPQVGNVGMLAYDDRYLYAAFEFRDPDPKAIRAPLGDRDQLSSATDYAGLIVDSRNDGRTAQMFLANPNGLLYDALTSDVSGEDSSPDFYWEAAGKITETGWNLELRIPFSTLRYGGEAEPTWGILLYRNYPRDRRYNFFTARMPRDANCFVCNASDLQGLFDLPRGAHLVVAPFSTAQQVRSPRSGLGTPLESGDLDTEYGLDVKWSPMAAAALDGTWNPDFSQVESDAAQIAANERFALFFAEKRPFFLEGVDLFSTPLQALYTRTITAPRGGARATGRLGATSYTALFARDRGGGLVILPGPQGSDAAPQDFESDVAVARVRHDLGSSFVSFMASAREMEGDAYNRVFGPDFQWRPRPSDSFTAQWLWSESRTPQRTDLAGEWDGRRLADRAMVASWSHTGRYHDWYLQGQDMGEDFRADNGFIPQVGYREGYFETGYTARPKDSFLSRVRVFTANFVDVAPGGEVLNQRVSLGTGMDGRWTSFFRVELNQDAIRVGHELLRRFRPRLLLESSPGRLLNHFSLEAYLGEEIDFANAREGRGATLVAAVQLRPSDRLLLTGTASRRWLNVSADGRNGRLFLAEIERVRATWMFNGRSFVRLIGQYVQTKRDVSLYGFAVEPKDATLSGSVLLAYKLNWQTVLYAGFGDDRTWLDPTGKLERSGQQAFAKVSYAWQQ
jgi:hypothetical protein